MDQTTHPTPCDHLTCKVPLGANNELDGMPLSALCNILGNIFRQIRILKGTKVLSNDELIDPSSDMIFSTCDNNIVLGPTFSADIVGYKHAVLPNILGIIGLWTELNTNICTAKEISDIGKIYNVISRWPSDNSSTSTSVIIYKIELIKCGIDI